MSKDLEKKERYATTWRPFSLLDELSKNADNHTLDIYKEGDDLHIKIPLAGFSAEEIVVEASKNYITVTAEQEDEENPERHYYSRSKRYFSKALSLPEAIDPKHMRAKHNGSRLHLYAPLLTPQDHSDEQIVKVKKEK